MKWKDKRKLTWIVGGALLVLLLAWAFWPRPEPADIATVGRAPLRVTLDEEGETRVRDRFVVSAPLAGRVLRIELEPGDPVEADKTVLAIFQPQTPTLLDARSRAEAEAGVRAARASLERARADRDRAAAELEFAESEVERFRRLAEEKIVSDEQLESAELEARSRAEALEAAEFSAQAARHQLEVARARLLEGSASSANPGQGVVGGPISLRSPIDGVVLRRLRESEAVVAAGEPLIEVGKPEEIEIVADYLSADAVKIRPGDRVLIEEWGGERSLEGRVRRVEPSGFMKISALGVEEQRVNVVIDFVDPPESRPGLADGFRVELRIVLWEGDDVLQVPTGSLFRDADEWAVFAVENGKARLRRVEIGRQGGLVAEVISGLEEGDQVILHPGDSIVDGLRVTPRPN
ncbi:MAG: HlyD family efflux transporter periplasmic adaptor subunit [Acidobacteriota bacterium]|nr:MAG: HlyD family efflux transporter periplasmic adaptor subunit [Acidobacteriota bacterium]